MLPKYAYFNGSIIPYEDAKIGVLNHTFNYGTGAFAGVRGYWNQQDEELYLFLTKDHFKRLLNSAKLLRMEFDFSPEDLTKVTVELLQREGLRQDVYIRPIIYFRDETIGVRLHDLECGFTMAAIPFGKYVANDDDAHVTISSWRRVDDNMVPARGKITGAYINTALIKTDAKLAGFDEALVLNVDGHLSEGSAMNFFMMRDGVLITPPVTDNILEGITRRTTIELAREELGLDVVERSVDRTEIYLSDELFMTGTAAEVTAVTKVDHRPIGDGKMGPVATQMRKLYDDSVRGKMEKYRHWNTPVFEKMMVK
jgi:branched-chain amino acid aminotransferase